MCKIEARGTAFTTYYIIVILDEPRITLLKSIQWDAVMPFVASIWEEKAHMHCAGERRAENNH
jgi:hypothetical protein